MAGIIYCIKNLVNNKCYIGQTVEFNRREKSHRQKLLKNAHINKHLQSAWNAYGENSFNFFIVELCDEDDMDEREQFWIDAYDSMNPDFGYNKRGGGSNGRLSEETKIKIGKANKGRPPTKECIKLAVEARKKAGVSEKTRQKISNSGKGRKHSDESKEKISKAKQGTKHSEKSLEKMKLVKGGVNNPNFGKKTKRAISKYFGVSYNKNRGWNVQIKGPTHAFLGYFKTEEEAAYAYNDFVNKNKLPNPLNNIESKKEE